MFADSRFAEIKGGPSRTRAGLLRATYLVYLSGQLSLDESLTRGRNFTLTPPQKKVVGLVSQGMTYKGIASNMLKNNQMEISHCLNTITDKWAVHNLFQVMAITAKYKLLD